MSIRIYHNPRCSKSRGTLALLKEKGIEPEIIFYLDTPPDVRTLAELTRLLAVSPRDLLRTGEKAYKDKHLHDNSLSDEDIFKAINHAPILLQRPIVVANGHARIGRPPEAVLEIL
ncbi:arsenate reductase (glutaredoxin) [Candidatus Sororendozoicomonas aggregata]|uniref:arsenate reductase (glutaredoxin) n=1 Tax=Candidatus Sororendozoicomonas aggregata TaxID=3073239 RepID=UPI002ED4675C